MVTTLLQHIAELSTAAKLLSPFLADCTNGRLYATVLRLSVVCLSVTYLLWLNGASYSKSYYWQPTGSRIWGIDWLVPKSMTSTFV